MKKGIYLIVITFLLGGIFNQSFSQNNNIDLSSIPSERIFVHHNTSLLFSGEYLYYRLYCINAKTKNLSQLSKIAYVELVGEDKKIKNIQKIKLKGGLGQGDFFVPVSLPSGNYKLLAYTQWMKNEGVSHFFQTDIAIINPYQGNQKTILDDSDTDDTKTNEIPVFENNKTDSDSPNNISLLLSNKNFGKREKVSLKIKSFSDIYLKGNYSISVRKIDKIKTPPKYTLKKVITSLNRIGKDKIKSIDELEAFPEFRGELISGKIISNFPSQDVLNKKIALSILGNGYQTKIVTTDKLGNFNFNLDKNYDENIAFMQVLGNKEKYRIEFFKEDLMNYDELVFNKFTITSKMEEMIVDRSIYNQIRNNYFSIKPDTLSRVEVVKPFYGDQVEIYELDDYTRFSTIKETLVEVVDNAWLKKIQNENYIFQVRYKYPPYNEPDYLPLVIVDGIIVQDHNDLVEYNARKIKRITLSRDKHYLGSHIFQGILDIETLDGDYYSRYNKDYIHKVELSSPLPEKKYFYQRYKQSTKPITDHIPDLRHQLLWSPDIKLENRETEISFFTSDNIGNYEICLEGLAKNGGPLTLKEIITVK